jgi:hypothetical protein
MDPEIRRLLEETKALTKDNHRMLRAIRRDQWFGFIAKIIIWAFVLALPIYLYRQYLEPIVSSFSTTTNTTTTGAFGLPTSADIEKLINSFKAGQ